MNSRILLLLLFLTPVIAEAQSPSINQFYREHKRDKGTINANLPGWLVKLGVGIARPFVDDEEARIALRLARKVGKTKFLIAEEESRISQGQFMKLIRGVKKDGYEEWVTVRDGGDNVTILTRMRKDMIKRMLIVVREEDSFVLLSMKTKIKAKHLSDMINDIMALEKEDEKNKYIETEVES